MTRIELSLPTKLQLSFEGSLEEFDQFVERLTALGLLPNAASNAPLPDVPPIASEVDGDEIALSEIRPEAIEGRINAVGAETDIERLTIMAFLAKQAGGGLSAEVADSWYSALGIRKPGVWKSTFANARTRGYIRHTDNGWIPTTAGENFAVHGIRRTPSRRTARTRHRSST